MTLQTAPTARFTTPASALEALRDRLSPVETERVDIPDAAGRVLAEPVQADRDNPSCDISAMDGYALRIADIRTGILPVADKAMIGQPVAPLPPGAVFHIVTGAAIPAGADAVVRVEDIDRDGDTITLRIPPSSLKLGQDIRRQGENLRTGQQVIPAGTPLTPATLAALASFGLSRPTVYRKLRIGILTTGDEVIPVDACPEPWQIRNANAASLHALFSSAPWTQITSQQHAPDDLTAITHALHTLLGDCDLILLTGGVSMGDRDYVPAAVAACGCTQVFHKLPIRPGKPILAAVGPRGQAILGLPGNPLSVLTTALRFAGPVARRLAGFVASASPIPIRLHQPDTATASLWWSRPVTVRPDGLAELVDCRGSGDVVAAARSDGFIELPPGAAGEGPWPFYPWRLW